MILLWYISQTHLLLNKFCCCNDTQSGGFGSGKCQGARKTSPFQCWFSRGLGSNLSRVMSLMCIVCLHTVEGGTIHQLQWTIKWSQAWKRLCFSSHLVSIFQAPESSKSTQCEQSQSLWYCTVMLCTEHTIWLKPRLLTWWKCKSDNHTFIVVQWECPLLLLLLHKFLVICLCCSLGNFFSFCQ